MTVKGVRVVKNSLHQVGKTILASKPAHGADHMYSVVDGGIDNLLSSIHFQNGPVKEVGVNGIKEEDLIVILIDRLQSFQQGPYSTRENAVAITKLEEALMWLNKRTADRELRSVEGTSEV